MEEKQETQKPSVTTFNGSYKKTKDSNIQNESSKIYSKRKHIVQNHSENFNNQDTSSQKLKMPKRSHESNQSVSTNSTNSFVSGEIFYKLSKITSNPGTEMRSS